MKGLKKGRSYSANLVFKGKFFSFLSLLKLWSIIMWIFFNFLLFLIRWIDFMVALILLDLSHLNVFLHQILTLHFMFFNFVRFRPVEFIVASNFVSALLYCVLILLGLDHLDILMHQILTLYCVFTLLCFNFVRFRSFECIDASNFVSTLL